MPSVIVPSPARETVTAQPETREATVAAEAGLVRQVARLATTAAQVAALGDDIRTGRVVLEPEAGERLIAALTAQLDDVEDWIGRAGGMSRVLPLGANPVGQAMSGKFQRRADGDAVSFNVVLERYRAVLSAALTAVRGAIRNYHLTDENNADVMRRIENGDPR